MRLFTRGILSAIATIIVMAECATAQTSAEQFVEALDPATLTTEQRAAWDSVADGLNVAWGSIDERYAKHEVPTGLSSVAPYIVAWRGERASAQLLLWSANDIDDVRCTVSRFRSRETTLPSDIARVRFVRYTLADGALGSDDKAMLAADMLDERPSIDIEARSVRPVWITIAVPRDAAAGTYTAEVTITHRKRGKTTLPITLEVQPHTLATPTEWCYHLDLWQHPTAVARAEGLELWSDEHFEALRRDMSLLAEAGQKVITATLNKDPWNHQCYDGYASMIGWTLHADGKWSYDYTIFDRWVELMLSLGIDKMINCYSMVPWNCELEYYDEASGEVVTIVAEPGTTAFTAMWRPFLIDFKAHLSHKGWLAMTNIAMDERAPEAMDAAVELLAECAPEMGFAIADMHHSYRRYLNMRDVCVAQEQPADNADILSRREQGFTTTFYVCCNPQFPNTFTSSHPFEAELLGWYGLASDYDGMLRWAYNSWPGDPAHDSRYGNWRSGDTYLIYPYARSSVRFERLVDGIEAAEKVRTLRAMGIDTSAIEVALANLRAMDINDPTQPWKESLATLRNTLNSISRNVR